MLKRISGLSRLLAVAAVAGIVGCGTEVVDPTTHDAATPEIAFAKGATDQVVSAKLQELNAALAAAGANYQIEMAELSLGPNASADAAQIIFAFDRNLRLSSKWVPGDARRLADGTNITYMNDLSFAAANGAGNSEPAIDASFDTWETITCSKLNLVKRPDDGALHSAFFGGNPFAADIYTLGFIPGAIFDAFFGPGASNSILGVTWTFIFGSFDSSGNFTPSDIDNNGRTDTALKEIWYNNAFTWTTTNTTDIDIETVALHENGHALELGHFGKVSINPNAGKLQVSPRAVMNAFILGVLRAPLGTDNASYCGNFASWPN